MSGPRPAAHRARIVANAAALYEEAAERFAASAELGVARSGSFRVVLSGGATPRGLYEILARGDLPFRARVPWAKSEFFWGDERPVPPDHPDSNYRMAREALLSRLPVAETNIHRIRGEAARAEDAAREYESILRTRLAPPPGEGPGFDLVLLGLGPDGHTASLFPGSAALNEPGRLVSAPWVEKLGTHRITLTPAAINSASAVLFLVSGAEKAKALAAVLEGPERIDLLPAQAIRPKGGELTFLVDRAAAGELHG